jgi:hypothetical protein
MKAEYIELKGVSAHQTAQAQFNPKASMNLTKPAYYLQAERHWPRGST